MCKFAISKERFLVIGAFFANSLLNLGPMCRFVLFQLIPQHYKHPRIRLLKPILVCFLMLGSSSHHTDTLVGNTICWDSWMYYSNNLFFIIYSLLLHKVPTSYHLLYIDISSVLSIKKEQFLLCCTEILEGNKKLTKLKQFSTQNSSYTACVRIVLGYD